MRIVECRKCGVRKLTKQQQQQQQRKQQEENGEKFGRFSPIFSSTDVNSKIISKSSAIQKQVKNNAEKKKNDVLVSSA